MTSPTQLPRLTLRDDLRDGDGLARPCIAWPGRPLPVAYPSITAALAALASMEANHGGR